ncbi:MAG TPA: hypothetical protein VKI44_07140 [Acetobacteraceae bacterium]|nr:hypothetical protein [Acetobacteraceae bacterium]
MDHCAAPEQPDLSLQLPRDLYWLILHTLRGLLPPPDTDAPDAETRRDRAAIALVASMLPGNAEEADLASRCVAHAAYGMHCLRQARVYRNDVSVFLKCSAQAASMERRAQSGRSLLQRLQAERRKREADAAATEQAAWVEHCAIGMMADALASVPATPTAAPPPEMPPAPEPEPEAKSRPLTAAEQRANVSPRRATPIAQPPPEMAQANVSGATTTLKALDAAAD